MPRVHNAMLRVAATALFAAASAVVPALTSSLAVARAAGAAPEAATVLQREQAQARFARAQRFFDAKMFVPALAEFRASLEIVNSPNTRLYVARCLEQAGVLVEAYVELGRTESEAREAAHVDGRYALTADEALAERNAIAPKLGFVTLVVVHAEDGTVVRVDGQELRRAAWSEPIPVQPGSSDFEAESPGRAPSHARVSVAEGERRRVELDPGSAMLFPPPAPVVASEPATSGTSASLVRPLAWGSAAVGVAGLALFLIEGLETKATYDDLTEACHGPCPAAGTHAADIAAGIREQTLADVGLAVGACGVVASVGLFVFGRGNASSQARSGVGLIISPLGVTVRGAL
jgi:hypothetical protein